MPTISIGNKIVLRAQNRTFIGTVLLNTHNICFYFWFRNKEINIFDKQDERFSLNKQHIKILQADLCVSYNMGEKELSLCDLTYIWNKE